MIQADAHALPLKDNSVDAIITSPPYFGSKSYGGTLGIEITPNMYAIDIVEALSDCYRVLKDHGVMWLILGDKDDVIPISLAPQRVAVSLSDAGWLIVQEITWIKTFTIGKNKPNHPKSFTEKIYILAKKMHRYRYYEDRMHSSNCWRISPSIPKGLWEELPFELVARCLKMSTFEGNIVLDPFVGTGMVPRVANQMKRIGIGSDLFLP